MGGWEVPEEKVVGQVVEVHTGIPRSNVASPVGHFPGWVGGWVGGWVVCLNELAVVYYGWVGGWVGGWVFTLWLPL